MNVSALKAALLQRGLPTGGKKAELVRRLAQGIIVPKNTNLIVSLDLGYKNCAMAVIKKDCGTLVDWRLESMVSDEAVVVGSVKVREVCKAAKLYYQTHLQPYLNEPDALVVVERQRYRSNGATAVLDNALINVVLETVFSVLIEERQWLSVEPKAVARYYNLPSGYAEKKRAAVRLVGERIKGVDDGQGILEIFKKSKKKDDLADALLQAWAVRDWIRE